MIVNRSNNNRLKLNEISEEEVIKIILLISVWLRTKQDGNAKIKENTNGEKCYEEAGQMQSYW